MLNKIGQLGCHINKRIRSTSGSLGLAVAIAAVSLNSFAPAYASNLNLEVRPDGIVSLSKEASQDLYWVKKNYEVQALTKEINGIPRFVFLVSHDAGRNIENFGEGFDLRGRPSYHHRKMSWKRWFSRFVIRTPDTGPRAVNLDHGYEYDRADKLNLAAQAFYYGVNIPIYILIANYGIAPLGIQAGATALGASLPNYFGMGTLSSTIKVFAYFLEAVTISLPGILNSYIQSTNLALQPEIIHKTSALNQVNIEAAFTGNADATTMLIPTYYRNFHSLRATLLQAGFTALSLPKTSELRAQFNAAVPTPVSTEGEAHETAISE
jgi:hypothetical protein